MTLMTEPQDVAVRPRKSGYLASLDGWRAIAIIGVMMTHDRSWVFFGHSLSFVMGYGGYGLYLFFAISGFLITTRILEEEALVGHFHIGRFYIRRIFRIQPAEFAFLTAVALIAALGINHYEIYADTIRTWVSSLFLYVNFLYHPDSPNLITGHFWTLAVEEHFYILLSLTLFFVKKHRTLALFLLLLAFTLPTELLSQSHGTAWYFPINSERSTQWQLTPLLLAALAAVLVRYPMVSQAVKRWLHPWMALLLTVIIAVAAHTFTLWRTHKPLISLHHLDAEFPLISTYLFILWVVSTVFHPGSLSTRFLELKPMRFIGKISYSLYLWHVLVFYFWTILFFAGPAPFGYLRQTTAFSLLQLPFKYAFVLLFGVMSYYFIEKPMVRIGHRLAPSATPGRPELADLPVEAPDPQSPGPAEAIGA
jgi:peptidoglycan/LPS O-acetylase OafA/YrhL